MNLAETAALAHATLDEETTHPVVYGPPFEHAPAGPCYTIGLPRIIEGAGQTPVWSTAVDVRCYPSSSGNYHELLAMADEAATALAGTGRLTVSAVDGVAQYLDADLNIYTLTVEAS
jgi:hypothetical protein